MALHLYRRHYRKTGKCLGGHPPDSRSYEPEELRRKRKKCLCPIYADGTLGEIFKRRNTGKLTWDEAKVVAAEWEAAGRWDGTAEATGLVAAPTPPVVEPPKPTRPTATIESAFKSYLANRASREIADSTMAKYKTLVKQLGEFTAHRGYMMIDQIQITDMDEFYTQWPDGIRSKAKKLERLKGFFKFCLKRKWITESPAEDLEAPVGAGSAANRMPFTDAELTRIYAACDELPGVEWKNQVGRGSWGGEDVKTLIMLLCWTGLRISDATTFDTGRATRHPKGGANIFLRMHKTNGALFTWIDDWLYERLLERERRLGPRIFALGVSQRLDTVTDLWRRKINRVFEGAGPFECGRPTPHVFRHTFIRVLLERGVAPRDAAELIGDTEEVVLKHYARWVPERQERLTNILREKLASAPQGRLKIVEAGG